MMNKKLIIIGLLGCAIVALFFSTYRLTESPKTWLDEGLITQVARNYAAFGQYQTQIAPATFVSAWHISTSCTVVCPIALSFHLLGYSLFAARLIMVFYMLALLLVCSSLLDKITTRGAMLLTIALIVSFAPFYGHGRNVLGEIPGLFFLFSALYFLLQIERRETSSSKDWLWLGLVSGLCITTKPIFILLVPALLLGIMILWRYRQAHSNWFLLLAGFLMPCIVWANLQFSGDSFGRIITFYANPQDNDIWLSVGLNLKRFFTESQPAYALILVSLWFVSIAWRFYQGKRVVVSEIVAGIFSALAMLAYIRTAGFYRYFFLPQFIALFYLVPSWFEVLESKSRRKKLFSILVISLVLFQFHQTVFHSWVAKSIRSTATADSALVIGRETLGKSVYIYGVPEAVNFLPHNNYWQYLPLTKTIVIGDDTRPLIKAGIPDLIIANISEWSDSEHSVSGPYRLKTQVGRFAIWARIK